MDPVDIQEESGLGGKTGESPLVTEFNNFGGKCQNGIYDKSKHQRV